MMTRCMSLPSCEDDDVDETSRTMVRMTMTTTVLVTGTMMIIVMTAVMPVLIYIVGHFLVTVTPP